MMFRRAFTPDDDDFFADFHFRFAAISPDDISSFAAPHFLSLFRLRY